MSSPNDAGVSAERNAVIVAKKAVNRIWDPLAESGPQSRWRRCAVSLTSR
jgi:hypothetical protein